MAYQVVGRLNKATNNSAVAVIDTTGMTLSQINNAIDNPDDYTGLTKFHSARHYPSIVRTEIVTVTLPSIGANSQNHATYNLIEHSQGDSCYVRAKILNYNGQDISMNGSTPIEGDSHGFARWLAIGASSTHIILHEKSLAFYTSSKPQVTLTLEIKISDMTVANYFGQAPGGPAQYFGRNKAILANGKFDSDKKYINADDSNSAGFRIVGGRTCKIAGGSSNYFHTALGLKYSNGAYTYRRTANSRSPYTVPNVSLNVNSRGIKL